MARHTHARSCEEQRKIREGGWIEENRIHGDGYTERSKDNDKSVMKKEWKRMQGGDKRRGAQPGAAAAPGGEREAAATDFGFICAARGRTRCVFGYVCWGRL